MDSNQAKMNSLKHYKKSMIDEYEQKNHSTNSEDDYDDDADKKFKSYCVCKTTDASRFMIACDSCDEWFHGDCVGINEAFSKKIKAFYCHVCRYKDKTLKLKYIKKYSEQEIKEKFWKETQAREAKEAELLKKLILQKQQQQQQEKSRENFNFDISKFSSQGKYGKSEISGEDIENFVSAIAKLGADVDRNQQFTSTQLIEHKESNDESQMDNVSHVSIRKRRKYSDSNDASYMTEDENHDDEKPNRKIIKRGRKKANENMTSTNKQQKTTKKQSKPIKFGQIKRGGDDDDNDKNNEDHHSFNLSSNEKQCLGPGCVNQAAKGSKYCTDDCGLQLAKNRILNFLKENQTQINTNRLKAHSNQTCSSADQLNETHLKRIADELEVVRKELIILEAKHVKLDRLVERARHEEIDENCVLDKDYEETEMFCVTCGQNCSQKHALKHMEKCFNKYESQAFFGSYYKSYHEGRAVFCDYYQSQTKMYCKRLKIMCPEHEKERKIGDDEVCGCPLTGENRLFDDSFDEASSEICLIAKKSCTIHFKWEKLRRAQLDLDKLRLLLKLDELYDQKRQHETALANRNGFLSKLLHKTIET